MSMSTLQFLRLPVEAMGLPEGIAHCLEEGNILYVWELLMQTETELSNLGISERSLVAIRRIALQYGFPLGCPCERMEGHGICFDTEVC